MSKELYVKRALYICQKSSIYMSKEIYIYVLCEKCHKGSICIHYVKYV